jgi:hypothetical protein
MSAEDGEGQAGMMGISTPFLEVCKSARTDLSVPFPSSARLQDSRRQLASERKKLGAARRYIELAQTLLVRLKMEQEVAANEWGATHTHTMHDSDPVGPFVISAQSNWDRCGLYAQSMTSLEDCMWRVTRARETIDLSIQNAELLLDVDRERVELARQQASDGQPSSGC